MFPFLRLGRVLASAPASPRLALLDESTLAFRVTPGDLDQNRHMNNGRYLTMMDLGRFDLLARTGSMPALLRRRWFPVVRTAIIRYRQPLDAFQRYELRTRVLGWDDEGVYIEQRFVRNGKVHAIGAIQGVFLGPQGRVSTTELVDALAPGSATPALPAWVESWKQSQDILAQDLRTAERA